MTEIRITVNNTSNIGGTFLTPVWFGFHDNSFDLFNTGEAASAGLEAIAEDGNAAPLGAELLEADTDGQGGIIPGAQGPITTREQTSTTVSVNGTSNGYLSLAAMLLPSNDAFIGTSDAVQIFDADGSFNGAQTLTFLGADVYDAGTEVNTELDAAFINQTGPNTGEDEGGVVDLHPGFNGSEGNPVGEGDQVILGGTNAFGEFIDPEIADFTRPGATVASIHINTVNREEGDAGDNVLIGGADDDIFNGGNGADVLVGFSGYDVLSGGNGEDTLIGGSGNDELFGGNGADKLFGGSDDDVLDGGRSVDLLVGGSGNDRLSGGTQGDHLYGNSGRDIIDGGSGRDHIYGGSGNDRIAGGLGQDQIFAGSGDDFIFGGAARDTIFLGFGRDTVLFNAGDGSDIVNGFGADDILLLNVEGVNDFTSALASAEQTDLGVELNFNGSGRILLTGLELASLTESQFDFV